MSLRSLIATGTKLWLDSIDPDLVKKNRALGATGATSNPIIISDLIKTGRFDDQIIAADRQGPERRRHRLGNERSPRPRGPGRFHAGLGTDQGQRRVRQLRARPAAGRRQAAPIPHAERVRRYIELGKKWATGHQNRMIKVPATAAGLDALEELAAAGITLNVTLIFSERQYKIARDNVWRGASAARTAWTGSRASTASSSAGWTCTPRSTCPTSRPPPRGWSAS